MILATYTQHAAGGGEQDHDEDDDRALRALLQLLLPSNQGKKSLAGLVLTLSLSHLTGGQTDRQT